MTNSGEGGSHDSEIGRCSEARLGDCEGVVGWLEGVDVLTFRCGRLSAMWANYLLMWMETTAKCK